jgi:hypothetical protein
MGYFKELQKSDIEFPNQAPVITNVKAVCVELKSLCESMIFITPWTNGEGFEISIEDNKGNNKYFQLHIDEFEGIYRGLKHLKVI